MECQRGQGIRRYSNFSIELKANSLVNRLTTVMNGKVDVVSVELGVEFRVSFFRSQ